MNPRFFLPCFHGPRASRLGHKRKEKTRSITCRTDSIMGLSLGKPGENRYQTVYHLHFYCFKSTELKNQVVQNLSCSEDTVNLLTYALCN